MNAAAYLKKHGWRGEGHKLHDTEGGLKERIPVGRREGNRGLGRLASDFGNQWWLNAWSVPWNAGVEQPQLFEATANNAKPSSSLYAHFVKAKPLEGTISLSQGKPITTGAMGKAHAEELATRATVDGSVDNVPVEKKSKKRKHLEDGQTKEKKSKKSKAKHDESLIDTAPSQADSKERKRERKKSRSAEGEATNGVEQEETPINGQDAAENKKEKKEERRKSKTDHEGEASIIGTQDTNIDTKHEINAAIKERLPDTPTIADGALLAPTKLESSAPADINQDQISGNEPSFASRPKKSKKNGKHKEVFPNTPEGQAARLARAIARHDVLPPSMHLGRAAMIANGGQAIPDKPVPSGPVDEKGRKTYVIGDFYPFVKGSEYSRRRAAKLGKPLRRSPRSIRHEAKELMQEQMIREALERGEEPPTFEKPKTRRQLREEKKARKRDPAALALKWQKRKLQKHAQLKRNEEVRQLREQGKYEEAHELLRTPLFNKDRRDSSENEKGEEEDDDDNDDEGAEYTDTDVDTSDPGSVSSDTENSTDDDIGYISAADSEDGLTEEQKKEREERRQQRREQRKAERAAEKEALKANPKTKRIKREERYEKMPEMPPPVLPVPKFKTITKGIPLPFTKRRGSLKELKMILVQHNLSQAEQQAYIHKAMVDKQEAINIKQSRRAAIRRERKKKRGIKKHDKHIRIQKEMAVNRRKKAERRAAGEFVETASEKKARHRRERAEKEERKYAAKQPRQAERNADFIAL